MALVAYKECNAPLIMSMFANISLRNKVAAMVSSSGRDNAITGAEIF
jgi:hypothetical protein